MKALVFNGELALREVTRPKRATGEALIRVILAGICGTDREILKGYSSFSGIPGHEFVGRVAECDDPKWLGKRVVGEINIACRQCSWCLRGLSRHCPQRTVMGIVKRDGAFAEFLALPTSNLHEVPAEISDSAAVFVEPLAAATEILEQIRIEPGTQVIVLGDGRLGLLVGQVLAEAGAKVALVGRHRSKLDLAGRWGMEALEAGTAVPRPGSFRVVVEATGSTHGVEEALRLVEPRGTVILKSTVKDSGRLDFTKLVVDEVTLLGSRCGNFSTALDLLRRGRVHVEPMITKVFPLEDGVEAFRYLQQMPCLKVLLANEGS
jgi:alcohol dehydrogenase